jgi:hypothetical protein
VLIQEGFRDARENRAATALKSNLVAYGLEAIKIAPTN